MLPLLADSHVLLRWDAHYLRLLVFGEVDLEACQKILSRCARHLDDAPFRRLIIDFSAAEEIDEAAVMVLQRGFAVLQGAGAELFLLVPDPAWKRLLARAGLRDAAVCGLQERDVEAFVRQAAARHRSHLAAVNAQAEAPRRWTLGGWLAEILTAEG